MELSNELKVERIRLSLTAKSVAEEMGISRQQLCNIEQSETLIRGFPNGTTWYFEEVSSCIAGG